MQRNADDGKQVRAVAFLLDGKLVAPGSPDETGRLWEHPPGATVKNAGREAIMKSIGYVDEDTHIPRSVLHDL